MNFVWSKFKQPNYSQDGYLFETSLNNQILVKMDSLFIWNKFL